MDTPERRIGVLAARQDNVVTRDQLRACGLSERQIAWRVRTGQLQRLFRGVYLAGYTPPTLRGRIRAATLACGAGAFGSHRAAAAIYLPRLPPPDNIDVLVSGRNPGAKPGVALHRGRDLARWETRAPRGVPITSPARTALDLAGSSPRAELEHVLQEMFFARLISDGELRRVMAAHPRHRGAAVLRALLALENSTRGHSRSEAERAFARLLADAQLPVPRRNVWLEGEVVDAVWEAQRLVVEIDGAGTHNHSLAFARDRRRDAKLVAAGWRVIRFTRRQVCEEPILVAVRLAQALALAA